jgi:hypothetical protein
MNADIVLAHLHAHELDERDGRMCTSPDFVHEFARAAVGEGANVVVVQGSHAPLRGIEVRDGVPIFYEPGDLFRLGRPDKVPQDFYTRWGYGEKPRAADAGPPEAYEARKNVYGWGDGTPDFILSPKTMYGAEPGFVVPICHLAPGGAVTQIDLHPMRYVQANKQDTGLPGRARGEEAAAVLAWLQELSAPYGTEIVVDGDVGRIHIS